MLLTRQAAKPITICRTMNYKVGLTIHNCFDVEAANEEEAEEKVRALGVYETLDDAQYEITYVDKDE